MISYYDLIGMVKEGNAPGTIEVKLCSGKAKTYIANYDVGEFSFYHLEFEDLEDDNYHYYLSECFLESSMFDKCITILDEEDELIDIEEFSISYSLDYIDYKNIDVLKNHLNKDFQTIFDTLDKLIKNQKKIIERLSNERD